MAIASYEATGLTDHFDHRGAGQVHTFPNEGSASDTMVVQPGDIVILPYCRTVSRDDEVIIERGTLVDNKMRVSRVAHRIES